MLYYLFNVLLQLRETLQNGLGWSSVSVYIAYSLSFGCPLTLLLFVGIEYANSHVGCINDVWTKLGGILFLFLCLVWHRTLAKSSTCEVESLKKEFCYSQVSVLLCLIYFFLVISYKDITSEKLIYNETSLLVRNVFMIHYLFDFSNTEYTLS